MADYNQQDEDPYFYNYNSVLEEEDQDERYYDYQPQQQPLSSHQHAFHHHHSPHDSPFTEPNVFYRPPPVEENFVTRLLMLFNSREALFAVAVAMGVILFTHHKDDIRAWFAYYFPPDVAVTDSLRVLVLQGMQLVYGWIQYVWSGAPLLEIRWLEWIRRRQRILFRGNGGTSRRADEDDDFHNSPGSSRRRNAAGGDQTLPALEWVPPLPGAVIVTDLQPPQDATTTKTTLLSSVAHAQMNTTPLEATFEHEDDYPAAWLVYHRVLGVVKRNEAQEFDLKMQQERLNAQQPLEKDEEEEEKKDEVQSKTAEILDDEKTVHHSNVSSIRRKKANSQDDSSSSSDNNDNSDPSSAASYPVLHSIAATG